MQKQSSMPQTDQQLTNASLSNHNEFWVRTKYGKKNATLFDPLDKVKPNHYDNFAIYLHELLHPNKMPSNNNSALRAYHSTINAHAKLTDNQWALSLLSKGEHAILAIERPDHAGTRMDWFDFVVTPKHAFALKPWQRKSFGLFATPEVALNKSAPGMVRYCPTNQGNPLRDIPADLTREELFKKLGWGAHAETWLAPKENVIRMLKDINHDFTRCETGELKFKFCGHSSEKNKLKSNCEELDNCKTWAIRKLNAADVAVAINTHNPINAIIAHTIAIKP